jgi:hypothetical protein
MSLFSCSFSVSVLGPLVSQVAVLGNPVLPFSAWGLLCSFASPLRQCRLRAPCSQTCLQVRSLFACKSETCNHNGENVVSNSDKLRKMSNDKLTYRVIVVMRTATIKAVHH